MAHQSSFFSGSVMSLHWSQVDDAEHKPGDLTRAQSGHKTCIA